MTRRGRGDGPRLEGRERDRVLSDYFELLGAPPPTIQRMPGMRGAALLAMALIIAPFPILIAFAGTSPRLLGGIAALALLGLGLSASLLISGVIGPRRRLWSAALRRCGHDVCVRCGYWLAHRAHGANACPECGMKDEEQPVELGERRGPAEWPRFEPDPPEPDERRSRS